MYILILLTILMIISSVVSSFTSKVQATTLYVGKLLGEPEFAIDMPTGFQDAITPKWQNTLNVVSLVLWVAILGMGSFVAWWGGILALLITIVVLNNIASRLMPQRLSYYVLMLANDMNNRVADYKREKDDDREDAAREMSDNLKTYYMTIKDSDQAVPTFEEAKSMPVGGYKE